MTQDVFTALADPTRRALLEELSIGERAVGELVAAVEASQPTVSKHLRVLRESGLVHQRAEGQKRFYRIEAEPLLETAEALREDCPRRLLPLRAPSAPVERLSLTLPPLRAARLALLAIQGQPKLATLARALQPGAAEALPMSNFWKASS